MSPRHPNVSSPEARLDWRSIDAGCLSYRLFLKAACALSAYHQATREGPPPTEGPCIYLAHHGAGYFNLDLAVAAYEIAWRGFFERGERRLPLRVVAARSQIERALPGLPHVKKHLGLIDPSEASCLEVLERGEQLLLTPGGSREAQPRGEPYRLRWENRLGFARLALKTGASLVPLAVVGGAEAFPGFALGKLSFWSPVPLPCHLRIALGEPIAVERSPERAADPQAVEQLQVTAWERTQALYDRLLARRNGERA
jgi:1-acyl-sn-glycerol-3-phosphate acyltransferase